jgi:hypothetical protein
MKNRGAKISDHKLRGEWAEMYFMTRAAEHGFQVNKPWGETASYDFVVGHRGQFVRVQVKSTICKDGGGYPCVVRRGKRPYFGDPFDYLAAYVILEDVWYIIPAKLTKGKTSIGLSPNLERSKYAPYKEAWHLLRSRSAAIPATIDRIEACAADFLPNIPEAGWAESGQW